MMKEVGTMPISSTEEKQHEIREDAGLEAQQTGSTPASASTIPTAADWYPNAQKDPGNPHNWPMWKRRHHTFIPCLVAFLCPFGSSVYTPAVDEVSTRFGVGHEVALLPFVFYLLGLSFGPVLAAPLSETFGRRIVYITALPLFAAFTIGAGFSGSITSLIVCRFFAGAASSPGLSLAGGSVADVWLPHQRAIPYSIFTACVQMGPAFGPLIGGFVTEKLSWRWTQWVILFGLAVVLAVTISQQETYKLVILKARAKRLGIPGPPQPSVSRAVHIKQFATKTITRPIHMLCTEPIVTLFDLYTAFTFGLLNAFFAAFSYVFQNTYHFKLGSTGLTYMGQAVGSIIGLAVILYVAEYHWLAEWRMLAETDPAARLPPERKLIIAKIGAPLLPISLFWFGWTARPSVHWISPVIAEAVFSCANILIFVCALLFLQDCYGAQYGASAASSNTFARYLTAFAFPLFAIQMFEGLGNGWACSLLGFVAVMLMPIPFAFDRYGEKIRAKSKYVPEELKRLDH